MHLMSASLACRSLEDRLSFQRKTETAMRRNFLKSLVDPGKGSRTKYRPDKFLW